MPQVSVAYFEKAVVTPLYAMYQKATDKSRKISERLMVKAADMLVCDSKNIEKYIRETYASLNPQTTFIAYGAEIRHSKIADSDEKSISIACEEIFEGKVKPSEV